jgi:hypothetical protein
MPDKRVEALNSINKNDYNSKYITLSDNTKVGIDLIQDLKKYFLLEFKNKYRYNYRKWTKEVIQPDEIYNGTAPAGASAPAVADGAPGAPAVAPVADGADGAPAVAAVAPGADGAPGAPGADGAPGAPPAAVADDADMDKKIIYKIIEQDGDDGIAIRKLIKYIQDICKKSPDDSKDIEIPEKIFNSDIALRKNYRDKSINYGYIPIIEISGEGTEDAEDAVYYKPLLEYNYTNYDFQEKSQIYDDLNKLNSIFKKNNYKDLDDLVILDFYKDFTKKIEKLKDDIISGDDDIKYDLIDNIYEKLAIIYEIKIGRNKKIIKKPIKEIVEAANAANKQEPGDKTPKDICGIETTPFNQILCDINKRAQIFNNLSKLKSGGKQAIKGGTGGAEDDKQGELKTTIDKLLSAVSADEKQRYKTYLEIDKNILEGFINDKKFKEYISKLEGSKSLEKLSKIANDLFKIKPKKINGKIEKNSITFENFNDFIDKIKEKATEDSNRYLAIIKYLNIITKNTVKTGAIKGGYPKEMPSNIRNQGNSGNQKQAVEDKMSGNPGKEYLKKLTDIYINLAKEYGKFIKDEKEGKELIKLVIKSPSDNEKKQEEKAASPPGTEGAKGATGTEGAKGATEGKDENKEQDEKKKLEELENENKENEKKSKNLEERKKQLTASLKVIKEELRKLYKACTDINLPYATEYNDFVKNIIKVGQLKYIIDDNPQINNNNEIIEAYNKELANIDKELGDIKIDIESNKKKIKDKKEVIVSQGRGQPIRPGDVRQNGGDNDSETLKLKEILKDNLFKLIKKDEDNNLYKFIEELKTVFDGDDDNDAGKNNASVKKYDENETLYEQIWNDYSEGVKSYYNNQKDKSALTYINEGEKLKNKVILYDLDPEIVLKITFQDKVVFLALMFAIRTFIMVLFEFLIDYNVVKSLRYAILIYAIFYLLILLLFTAFVNLDSYKLRIVFNYLNMHINTPGIILHIMLFIIFSILVIIIIQTDNFINNLGDILDYTYIYNYIYTFNFDNILSGEFENNLTKEEKIKLQYRLDIISMLIFIFSGTLILLM